MPASHPPPHKLNAPTVYDSVIHTGQKIIQAVKFMRPSTDPARMITVIAANTNWKKTSVAIGNVSSGMPDAAAGTIAGANSNDAEATGPGLPTNGNHCSPKPIL